MLARTSLWTSLFAAYLGHNRDVPERRTTIAAAKYATRELERLARVLAASESWPADKRDLKLLASMEAALEGQASPRVNLWSAMYAEFLVRHEAVPGLHTPVDAGRYATDQLTRLAGAVFYNSDDRETTVLDVRAALQR